MHCEMIISNWQLEILILVSEGDFFFDIGNWKRKNGALLVDGRYDGFSVTKSGSVYQTIVLSS